MDSFLNIVYDKWITLENGKWPLPNGLHPIMYKIVLEKNKSNQNLFQIIEEIKKEIPGDVLPFDHSNFYGYTVDKIKFVDILDIDVDSNNVYIYPVEFNGGIDNVFKTKEFFSEETIKYTLIETIDERILDSMRKGIVKLLIHAAQDPYFHWGMQELENYFNDSGVDPTNIIFVPGNDSTEDYLEHYPNGKIKISPVTLMVTQQCARMSLMYPCQTSLGYISDLVKETDLNKKVIRPHKFICLNRTMRSHRVAMAYCALKNNLLKDNIFTFLNSFGADSNSICNTLMQFDISHEECEIYSKLIYKILPYELDTRGLSEQQRGGISISNTRKEWYLNSYVSIVTETSFIQGRKPFISEKLWRPVMNLQPFILVGNYGTLRMIKDLGFKTFNSLIDESYDDVYDYKQRMNMIFKEINKLNNMSIKELHDWYYSISDVLIHNLKTLRQLKDIDPYRILFDDLLQTYGKK
jgi:hypothetical protein